MTIRSIAAGAHARTAASTVPQVPGAPPVIVTVPAAGPVGVGGPGGTIAVPGAPTTPASADTLLSWVPTEVVVLYTTVLGVLISAVAGQAAGNYLTLRWVLYGGCIAATCLAVLVAYYLQPAVEPVPQKPPGLDNPALATRIRRVPIAETVAAALAFGIWGLVIPGSPLYVVLDPPTLPVVITTLSAVGVFLITVVFGPWLGRPAKLRQQHG